MTHSVHDSVLDVLARSILVHPTLFAESCEMSAREDREYVAARPDMSAGGRNGATARAAALEFAAKAARTHDSATAARVIVERKNASWIAAFNVACKLQCIPSHVRTALAIKWDAENAT